MELKGDSKDKITGGIVASRVLRDLIRNQEQPLASNQVCVPRRINLQVDDRSRRHLQPIDVRMVDRHVVTEV